VSNNWEFYGRESELADIERIISSDRWFFCSISGRRRIGKTTLIKQVLQNLDRPFFYFQVPDSDERGVVQAFWEAWEDTFDSGIGAEAVEKFDIPELVKTFQDMVFLTRLMNIAGWIVIIDEFQYFHRKQLSPFTSYLQKAVDELRANEYEWDDEERPMGGIFVLGSIHTEMTAVLEDRASPLFGRLTDTVSLEHWDFSTLFEMFDEHNVEEPEHWLFLWSLFEGVPKFYRDCFDQGVLSLKDDYRQTTLLKLFFEGSSPLKDEAENWFLRELRGRYDSVLKLLANNGPSASSELRSEYERTGAERELSAYLAVLTDRYQMVEKQQPIFSGERSRKTRYAITDNFLTAWMRAIRRNLQMAKVQPIDRPLARADEALKTHEGFAFEKMTRLLTQESSRKGVGDFALTDFVHGYWNKADGSDIEIDLVALNEDEPCVRFGSCKRSASAHDGAALQVFDEHVDRFLQTKEGRRLTDWRVEKVLYSPIFDEQQKQFYEAKGYLTRDLQFFRDRLYPV
jgi:uncharacterized protein